MPVLTGSTPAVTDLAAALVDDLQSGRAAPRTFGARDAAFEWAAGLPNILARQVNSALVAGLTFNAVRIKPSATPAAKVAPKAQKPNAVDVSTDTITLPKYSGIANFTTEQAITTEALTPALASVLVHSILMAYDADCAAELDSENGLTATGADWVSGINNGIAAVAGAGGSPGVLAIGAGDYATAVASPGVGYAMNPTTGVPSMYGLAIVLMAGVAAGTAYVVDPGAVLALENAESPVAVLNPYGTGFATNEIAMSVSAFLGFVVVNPAGVCQVTVSGGASSTSSDESVR